jgi:hypothetical protein
MHAESASPDVATQSIPVDPFALIGTLLDRKYRVDRVVAEGGFGVVYAGRHLALSAPIAIKVLRPMSACRGLGCEELLARFLQEAQTIARLRHPNIVKVLDAGATTHDDAPVPWMVLEWLDGETLREHLSARRGSGGISPTECLGIMRPILLAIAEAHDAGIAHRDLKPSNIMMVPTNRGVMARVLDFGIAKVMGGDERASSGHTTTHDELKAFSVSYAAPEQVAGTRTGPWTDVHAIGLLMTELLTDAGPYADEEPAMQIGQVVAAQRPTPATHGVDVGPWEEILARALALRPVDRYASVMDLLHALEETVDRAERRFAQRRRAGRARSGYVWLAVGAFAGLAVTLAGAIDLTGGSSARLPVATIIHASPPAAAAGASVEVTRAAAIAARETADLTAAPAVSASASAVAALGSPVATNAAPFHTPGSTISHTGADVSARLSSPVVGAGTSHGTIAPAPSATAHTTSESARPAGTPASAAPPAPAIAPSAPPAPAAKAQPPSWLD